MQILSAQSHDKDSQNSRCEDHNNIFFVQAIVQILYVKAILNEDFLGKGYSEDSVVEATLNILSV